MKFVDDDDDDDIPEHFTDASRLSAIQIHATLLYLLSARLQYTM